MDFNEPISVKVCRICLEMNQKLYPMQQYQLDEIYRQLTGLPITDEDTLPQYLCVECATRLKNFANFSKKSLTTHCLLIDLLEKDRALTIQNIKTIDRVTNKLISNLNYNMPFCFEKLENTQTDIQEVKLEDIIVKSDPEETYFDEREDVHDIEPDMEPDIEPSLPSRESSVEKVIKKPVKKLKKKVKKVIKKKSAVKVKKKAISEDDETEEKPKKDRRRKPFLNDNLTQSSFTISSLSHEEQIAEITKRQESTNYKNSVFKCSECFKGFVDEEAFNSHMVRHTDQCGKHACDICKARFKDSNAVRKHKTAHHTHRFSCNTCEFITTRRQTARLHERWHKGTKYQCPHCPDEFLKLTTYMGHIRIKHPSDFVCELCGYSFVSLKGKEMHKNLKHRLDDQPIPTDGPECIDCNIRFATEDALMMHQNVSPKHGKCKRNDAPSKPFKIAKPNNGGRSTRGRKPLAHIEAKNRKEARKDKRRTLEQPICCEQCGLQMYSAVEYRVHFNKVHPNCTRTLFAQGAKPCLCYVCGKMFTTPGTLNEHMADHTDAPALYKCETCGKQFKKKSGLQIHRNIHTGKRYSCPICGKMFTQVSNRDRHYTYVHSTVKDVKCDYCEKYFKSVEEKKMHSNYVHFKKPYPKRSASKRERGMQDAPVMKRKRDGYMPQMIDQSWLRESESSEASYHSLK